MSTIQSWVRPSDKATSAFRRYGTRLRIYKMGRGGCCYTFVPVSGDKDNILGSGARESYLAFESDENGYVSGHLEVPTGFHASALGRRVAFSSLSERLQRIIKAEYPSYFEGVAS